MLLAGKQLVAVAARLGHLAAEVGFKVRLQVCRETKRPYSSTLLIRLLDMTS